MGVETLWSLWRELTSRRHVCLCFWWSRCACPSLRGVGAVSTSPVLSIRKYVDAYCWCLLFLPESHRRRTANGQRGRAMCVCREAWGVVVSKDGGDRGTERGAGGGRSGGDAACETVESQKKRRNDDELLLCLLSCPSSSLLLFCRPRQGAAGWLSRRDGMWGGPPFNIGCLALLANLSLDYSISCHRYASSIEIRG